MNEKIEFHNAFFSNISNYSLKEVSRMLKEAPVLQRLNNNFEIQENQTLLLKDINFTKSDTLRNVLQFNIKFINCSFKGIDARDLSIFNNQKKVIFERSVINNLVINTEIEEGFSFLKSTKIEILDLYNFITFNRHHYAYTPSMKVNILQINPSVDVVNLENLTLNLVQITDNIKLTMLLFDHGSTNVERISKAR